MPWKAPDATRHNHAANTPVKRRVWVKIANGIKAKGGDDATAIREANAAVDRIGKKK